jgi:hypothetical protein
VHRISRLECAFAICDAPPAYAVAVTVAAEADQAALVAMIEVLNRVVKPDPGVDARSPREWIGNDVRPTSALERGQDNVLVCGGNNELFDETPAEPTTRIWKSPVFSVFAGRA